jgi:ATP-binding cassette, subfamily B, bacterial MsbA
MIQAFVRDFQAKAKKTGFVLSFLSRKLSVMLVVCVLLFAFQALWEGVVVSAVAVLLDGLFGGGLVGHLPNPSAETWYRQAYLMYRDLPSDQRLVTGFVVAASAMFFRSLLNLWVYTFRTKFQTLYIYEVSRRTFSRLLYNKMTYFDNNQKGVLIQMVMNETRSCYNVLRSLLDQTVYIFTIIAYFAITLFLSKVLTLFIIVVCILLFQLIRFLSNRIKNLSAEVVTQKRTQTFITDEGIGYVKQIKLFGFYEAMCRDFNKVSWESEQTNRKALILNEVQSVATSFFALATFVMLVIVNWKGNILAPGLFLTYLYVIKNLTQSLASFNHEWGIFFTHFPGMERISQAFRDYDEFKETCGSVKKDKLLSDRIVFDNVTLDYGKGIIAKDFSLVVRRGQKVAIVGESGSGKTSIINVLVRLYDPVEGQITIDGTPLQDFDLEFLRSRIGLVNQDTIIFNRSIEENIWMARAAASHEDVVSAAQRAHAQEFIERLPSGYQSPVGDRGVKLSGGQRQRINIAQVFLKDPEILIFDEATSALDTKSEQTIQQVLEELGSDKTVFMVAHRLSTVRQADIICVLKKGEVVEQGSWDELVAKRGQFAEMVRAQTITSE